MMNRRVTQGDVAKKAGVHVTTVSLALRNHPSLPETTRRRIQELAEQMGYRPDPTLRALINYRSRTRPHPHTPTIAYVTNWDTRWGWKNDAPHAEFYTGACERALELGYQIEHFWLGESNLSHQRLSDMLCARGITGIIVASHLYEIDSNLAFNWSQFSAVKIDFIPHEPALHNVTNDQRAVIQLAMRHTMAAGYRRIGFVMDRHWDLGVDRAWSAGYLAEQQLLAPEDRIPMLLYPEPANGELPRATPETELVPRDRFAAWLETHRPDALISTSRFVEARLAELKLSVPQDLAYVDILLSKIDGQIAGVRQNCRRVGELAMEILSSQLQQNTFGIPAYPTSTLVEGTWFGGASLPPKRLEARPTRRRPYASDTFTGAVAFATALAATGATFVSSGWL